MPAGDGQMAQHLAFLSTEPASRGERQLAWIVAPVSPLAFVGGLPFVRVPLPPVPAFIPCNEAAPWISDTITTVLLFSQFVRLRPRAPLLLGTGYLFDLRFCFADLTAENPGFRPVARPRVTGGCSHGGRASKRRSTRRWPGSCRIRKISLG